METRELYFIRITGESILGWNSVYANSLSAAKIALKKKLGKFYNKIAWDSLLVGKDAEKENNRVESKYAPFD